MLARPLALLTLLVAACAVQAQNPVTQPVPAGKTADKLVTVTYAVADLVVPIQGLDYPASADRKQEETKTKDVWLIDKIARTVAPATWTEAGGAGTIHYYPLAYSLVVCNTARVQAQVLDLLDTMRRVQNIEVSAETRVVASGDGLFLDVLKRFPALARQGHAVLSEAETAALVKLAQTDASTTMAQAPKITFFPGQRVALLVDQGQKDHGVGKLDAKLRALVAANLQHVHLDVNAQVGDAEFVRSTRLTEGATLAQLARAGDKYVLLLVTPRVHVCVDQAVGEAADKAETPRTLAEVVQAAAQVAQPNPLPRVLPEADPRLARLLRRYEEACSAGDRDKALRLAQRALAIDPACFRPTPR